MEKISQSELLEKLNDLDIPTSEITQYFRPSADKSRPFSPRFEIDPSRVDLSTPSEPELYHEGLRTIFIDILNRRHRRRRQVAYEKRIADGWRGRRFVAEGDSWFQYPWRENDDLIDFLDDNYAINCISAAGDEFKKMLAGKENIATVLKNTSAHGLLFSGGGNDIAGEQFKEYLRDYNSTYQARDYINQNFEKFLQSAKKQYTSFFNFLLDEIPNLKIFFHGYDRSFPTENGDWLGPTLVKKKIPKKYWHEIISILIDQYNVMLSELPHSTPDNLIYIDCRGAVGPLKEWRDELHALEGGCKRAAQKFEKAIETAFSPMVAAMVSDDQLESVADNQTELERISAAQSDLPIPDLENASDEFLQEGELLPDWEIGIEDVLVEAPGDNDKNSLEAMQFENASGRLSARWASDDENSTEYAHLSTLSTGRDFEFTSDDLELLVELNHFELHGHQGKIVFGLRGAALKTGHQAENTDLLELKDIRPDHINLRCVMGFYDFNEKRIWAYTASTVPNARNMHAYYRKFHKLPGRKRMANMMPTGAYAYRQAPHGWDKGRKKWKVPRALRLTDSATGGDGASVVLRTRNDLIYGTADYWHETQPLDNIHPAFSTTTFSSAGCLTIRGTNRRYTNSASGQWKKFLDHIMRLNANDRIDLMLLTGADAAIASKLRNEGNTGNALLLSQNLERLRIGSSGDNVKKLQEFLQLGQSGIFDADTKTALIEMQMTVVPLDKADGIYSPEMDELFGISVMSSPEPVPTPTSTDVSDRGPETDDVQNASSPTNGHGTASAAAPASAKLESIENGHAHDEEDMYPELAFEEEKGVDWAEDSTLEAAGLKLWYPHADRSMPMRVKGEYRDKYPMGAVIHSTEGRSKKGDRDAVNTIKYGIGKKHCYFCISSTGKIYQPAPLSRWGIHAGRCYAPSLGRHLDNKLMGIEVCCAGMMDKVQGGYKTWWGDVYPENEVRETKKVENVTKAGHYHKFNEVQEKALVDLLLWLHQNNPDVFKLDNVFGHDEIAVFRSGKRGRKQDPGASLSSFMSAFREKLKPGFVGV